MFSISPLEPVNYLIIGHITRDILDSGERIGGTAVYSSLTAHALGLRVGIVTSCDADLPLESLSHIPTINFPADYSTTFENIYTRTGRVQIVHTVAPRLDYHMIPEPWRHAPIVHLGPVAQEVEPALIRYFPTSMVCVTPQGWLRTWDKDGRVSACEWPEAGFILQNAAAAVISVDDVSNDENRIEELVASSKILVVTEEADGARVYWNGDVRRFRVPHVNVVDQTGAGDIFAAAFFTRLYLTRDPWESARFANKIASTSVARSGLDGIPTRDEVQEYMVEVI